jgi:hypothetical protein
MVYKKVYNARLTENASKKPFATPGCERLCDVGGRGLEPPTPSLSSNGTHNATGNSKPLTPTHSAACTAACTSEGETANADAFDTDQGAEGERIDQGDPLAKIAAELAKLSTADQDRLVMMLVANQKAAKEKAT